MANLLTKVYQQLGTELLPTDSHIDRINRVNILDWMCRFGNQDCLNVMNEKLLQFEYVNPDLQTPVYSGGMRSGGSEEFQYLTTLYLSNSTEPYQRDRVISGMGCSSNPQHFEA